MAIIYLFIKMRRNDIVTIPSIKILTILPILICVTFIHLFESLFKDNLAYICVYIYMIVLHVRHDIYCECVLSCFSHV